MFPMTERQKYLAAIMRQQQQGSMSPVPGMGMNSPFINEDDRAAVNQVYGRQSPNSAPPSSGPPRNIDVPDRLGPAPGPVDPMTNPDLSLDITGGERSVDRGRQMADQIRNRAAPKGKTVGPLNVYTAPNWGEVAAHVGEQLTAGGLERAAGKKAEEVSEQRLKRSAAENARDVAMYETERKDVKIAQDLAQAQLDEKKRAAKVSEEMDLTGLAMDSLDLEPQQYIRNDGSKLFVGYRLNNDNNAIEPYNLNTGKKVDLTNVSFDPESLNDGKSFNEPVRFVDGSNNDERMLSWNKGGYYMDAATKEQLTPDQLNGWIPEREMSEAQREEQVGKWIEKNGDTLELMHDMSAASAAFAKANPEGGGSPEGVFNWATKQKGAAGDVFRAMADIGEDGSPTQDAFAAAQTVFNSITRIRAGLSQTATEVENISREIGQDLVVSPAVLVQYWDRLGTKVAADLARAEDTTSPSTIRALNRWRQDKANNNLSLGYTGGDAPPLPEPEKTSGRGIQGQQSKKQAVRDAELREKYGIKLG